MTHKNINCSQLQNAEIKIRNYELFQVPPRWLFLKIETDDGITGWGEPVIEGKAATINTAVNELFYGNGLASITWVFVSTLAPKNLIA